MFSSNKIMAKEVAAGVLGAGIGAGVGYFVAKKPITLPKEYKSQLDRLKFKNKTQNIWLSKYKVLGHFFAPATKIDFYVIGFEDTYGLAISDMDFHDIIIKLGYNKETKEWSASIVHNGWDSIEVYKDDVLITTFDLVTQTGKLYYKFYCLML
jgi:hypothetical protein